MLLRNARISGLVIASLALPVGALAQTPDKPKAAPAATAAKPAAPAAKPESKPESKPAPKKDAKKDAKPAVPAIGGVQPTLLGQYADWGAYTASPGGKKLCFVIARPASMQPAGVKRDPSYLFVSTRPAEKVKDEISVIVGYPTKPNVDASAEIGATSFAMYTQNDGAWIKNAADEPKMVAALRSGGDVVIKAESGRGTKTSDTYSLKGLAQALDRAAQECK
jgi:hypothetical protein